MLYIGRSHSECSSGLLVPHGQIGGGWCLSCHHMPFPSELSVSCSEGTWRNPSDTKEKLTSLQEPAQGNQGSERPHPLQAFGFLSLGLASSFHFLYFQVRFLSDNALYIPHKPSFQSSRSGQLLLPAAEDLGLAEGTCTQPSAF